MANLTGSDHVGVCKIKRDDLSFGQLLGIGGSGIVYRAMWTRESTFSKQSNKVEVAVKVTQKQDLNELEIQIHSKLDHPNIVKLLGVVDNPIIFMLVFELCEGGNLRDYLNKHKNQPLPPNVLNAWSQQAARAIGYLHENGIIHCDIKSSNYLIDREGILKLTDFGISEMGDCTMSTKECGTVHYMAPEIFRDLLRSPRSDIFALGIVLWELLTRQIPFEGMGMTHILFKVGRNKYRLPIPEECPKYFSDLIQKCWADNDRKRPGIPEILVRLVEDSEPVETDLRSQVFPIEVHSGYATKELPVWSSKLQNIEESDTTKIKSSGQSSSYTPTPTKKSETLNEIPFANLLFHQNIGRSRFSEVYCVTFNKMYRGNTKAAAKKLLVAAHEEIEMLGSLSHQHIVTVFGITHSYPISFLVLELAPHGSLHDYLTRNKVNPVPEDLVRKWLKEAALAIEHLHDKNILHMDIKSQNCLLFHNYTLKLCDFGLASKLTDHGRTQTTLKGTWRFCAPELLNPSEGIICSYSKLTDIFAYGMLMFEICTREVPFAGMSMFQLMLETIEKGPVQPTIPANCPKDVSELMKRCWDADPPKRPPIGTILEELVYLDLERATREGLSSINLNVPSVYQEKSEEIGSTGGKITLHDTGVVLKIPPGAIEGDPVEITVSVHWDREYHPDQANGFVIGPAIQCKPEGLTFRKPVTITLPHSTANVNAKDLCIWTKNSSENQWHIIWAGNGHGLNRKSEHEDTPVPGATVLVVGDKIKLRVYHFSPFSSWWQWVWPWGSAEPQSRLDIKPVRKMVILTFMHPPRLTSPGVFISIYVVREDEVQNVIAKEKASKSCMCATERRLTMNLSRENAVDMHFILKPLAPVEGWEPDQITKTIEYTALQLGEQDSMCFMYFTKTPKHINGIMGQIEIYREKRMDLNKEKLDQMEVYEETCKEKHGEKLLEMPFSDTMCDIPRPAEGADEVANLKALAGVMIAEEPATTARSKEAQHSKGATSRRRPFNLDNTGGHVGPSSDLKKSKPEFAIKATDSDFRDVVGELCDDELQKLFQELDKLKPHDIENAQSCALGQGIREKGKAVLRYWRQKNGHGATRQALLEGLQGCGLIDAKEILEGRWEVTM